MAETIHNGKWHWYNIESDLNEQGCNVTIDPLSVSSNFCSGCHDDKLFSISWASNFCLFVSMQQFSQKLIDAFSQIVEYQPLCKYKRGGMITVNWLYGGKEIGDQYIEGSLRKDERISDIVLLQK